jgi:hypothetical protein
MAFAASWDGHYLSLHHDRARTHGRIWLRTLQHRRRHKQNLALEHLGKIFDLPLRILGVDHNIGPLEVLADVLEDAIMRLERVDLEGRYHVGT